MILRNKFPFENHMSPLQTTLGWIYLVIHIAVLPIALPMLGLVLSPSWSSGLIYLVYQCLGIAFIVCVMMSYLRWNFDVLAGRFRACVIISLMALASMYVLNFAVNIIMLLCDGLLESNPNNSAIQEMARQDYGMMKTSVVFLAPIVEEVLFRGVLFGSLRKKNRAVAYVVSIAAFSLCHTWQYALAEGGLVMLLYSVQYVPLAFAFTWAYENSGSIWTSIFLHMGNNAVAFFLLNLLDSLT